MKTIHLNLSSVCGRYGLFHLGETALPYVGDEFIYRDVSNFRKSVEGVTYTTGKRMYDQLRRDFEKREL